MKSRIVTFLLLLAVTCFTAMADAPRNRALEEANAMYNRAHTIQDYRAARNKYSSARYEVVMGNELYCGEYEQKIKEGEKKCDTRIAQLEREQRAAAETKPRPQQQGSNVTTPSYLIIENDPVECTVNVNDASNTRLLDMRISNNLDGISFASVPSWIHPRYEQPNDLYVTVDENPSDNIRNGSFKVLAGPHEVTVKVKQAGHKVILPNNLAIDDIEFGSSGQDIQIDFGQPLYVSEIRYLVPRIKFHGIYTSEKTPLSVKIISPDGKLLNSDSRDKSYTYSEEFYLRGTASGSNKAVLTGVGWGDQSMYQVGPWTCEIWKDGNMLFSKQIDIVPNASASTPLWVDGKMRMQYDFAREGGEHKFTVSAAPGWEIVDIPRFATVTARDANSFTLCCAPNTDIFPRSRDMKVRQGSDEVLIRVYQPGSTDKAVVAGAPAEVKLMPGQDRIILHVAFSLQGMVDHRVNVAAQFWDDKGRQLVDNGQPITIGRAINVQDDIEADDFKVNILAQQLKLKKGKHTITYRIIISDADNGEVLTTSHPMTFDYQQK